MWIIEFASSDVSSLFLIFLTTRIVRKILKELQKQQFKKIKLKVNYNHKWIFFNSVCTEYIRESQFWKFFLTS